MNQSRSSNVVVVLDRPQNASNIGATIRAMKNMGFSTLRLVNPKPFQRNQILRVAHRSEDLVDALQIYDDLDLALADVTFVVGASPRAHAGKPFTNDVGTLSANLTVRADSAPVALLFGTEADGLDNFALDRCHQIAALPVDPAYPSLNLAQAVLLFLYEMRRAMQNPGTTMPSMGSETLTPERSTPQGAASRALTPQAGTSQAELQHLFSLTETMLHEISFFRYNPEFVMRSVRDLVFRAAPAPRETALLVSIVRRIRYGMDESAQGRQDANGKANDEDQTH